MDFSYFLINIRALLILIIILMQEQQSEFLCSNNY